jgi:YggT family protein
LDSLAIGTLVLNIVLGLAILFFVIRIVLSWYPQAELDQLPYSIVAIPTEPLLVLLRKAIPPIGGVDITPVIWVGIFSLVREILLGQQGLITMINYH